MSPNPNEIDAKVVLDLIDRGRIGEAYTQCLPLAEAGSTMAQLHLGWMYQTGNGTSEDLTKAEYWYRRALASDPPRAAHYLGTLYWQKNEIPQTLDWFERSASQGYAPAIYQLGRMYRCGYRVPVDEKKGWDYIEKAAREGHVFARRDIARDTLQGRRGVSRIPLGFYLFVSVLWSAFRIAARTPHHDLILRPLVPHPTASAERVPLVGFSNKGR